MMPLNYLKMPGQLYQISLSENKYTASLFEMDALTIMAIQLLLKNTLSLNATVKNIFLVENLKTPLKKIVITCEIIL